MKAWLARLTVLQLAIGFSVAVHALLLGWRWVDPIGFDRAMSQTPLEVILVNAKSKDAPDKAQAYAQYNLQGGGESADARQRVTTPLPPSPHAAGGDDAHDASRQAAQLQEVQNQLLAQVRRELAALPPPDPRRVTTLQQDQADQARRRQLLDLLGEIEKRINEENSRPKKRYLSPATREASEALYYDRFRRKVERMGTENFPTLNGKRLYGELVMLVWVNKKGEVVETEIAASSGQPALDRRAEAIVRKAGPFGDFPEQMRQRADLWAIASRFKFTREAGVEARLSTVQSEAP